jgi:hypothetical protein
MSRFPLVPLNQAREVSAVTRVVVSESVRQQLRNFTEVLELCDDSGRVLARVFPVPNQAEAEAARPPLSEAEVRRRKESDRWYTTAEVLKHLESL